MNFKQSIKITAHTVRFIRNQWLSEGYFKRYQLKKLKDILTYSFQNVPFYRDTAWRLKINASNIASVDDLKNLPIVTKELIQKDPQRFLSVKGDRHLWFNSQSSGSTGQPVQVFLDPDCWLSSRYALKIRSLYAMGFPVWGKLVVVRIVEPEKLQQQWDSLKLPLESYFRRRRYLSTFESPEEHLKFYRQFRPHAIHGPPSYFRRLAEVNQNSSKDTVRVPIVFCVSELLDRKTRLLVEECFEAEVYDIYGCVEFKDVAWECKAHNGYHINAENVIVEVVQDGDPLPEGQDGEILLTSLSNRAMPLIRYNVGDRGSLSERICSCGRGLPMMNVIEGRSVDLIKLPNGNKISPYKIINLFEEILELKRFKIIQRSDFSLDVYLTTSEASKTQKISLISKVESILRKELNSAIEIRCDIVKQIEVKPGEKCRFIRSELSAKEA